MSSGGKKHNPATTRLRLLDAAERLFGEHGYNGVGMRALTEAARVNLAATAYHFGSKKTLYAETFLRRFRVVNAERVKQLATADREARGLPLTVECIVDCLLRPAAQVGLEHPAFDKLVGRSMLAPPKFLHAYLKAEFEPVVKLFIGALERALPAVPVNILNLRLGLAMGAIMMLGMQMSSIRMKRDPKREAAILKELVRFAASGLASPPATVGAELALVRPPVKTKRNA
ncbi:MAG TPA: TetR/AcrR family transcriptional regulator [Steroidobacteraceae bacterium]